MKYYPFINGLRAVAIIPVILFHFNNTLFSGGYAGVDVFFVISGFLITGLLMEMLESQSFSLKKFYERRARRILPALFLMCLICLVFCTIYFMPQDFKLFGRSLLGVAIFGTNFTFLEDVGYFAKPALVKPLLHTWSLAVEEQFYILYPLILYALFKRSSAKRNKLTLYILILFIISFVLNLVYISVNPELTFYMLHTRAWELLAGALTFIYLKNINLTKIKAEVFSVAGFLLLLVAFIYYTSETPFPGLAAVVPVLGTVLLIWPNINSQTVVGRLLSYKPVIGIGLISYGLYLYHWPFLVLPRYYLDREMTSIEIIIALVTVLIISIASYFLLENPIRTKKILPKQKDIFYVSLIALIIIIAISLLITKTKGLPDRFSDSVKNYVTDEKPVAQECTPFLGNKHSRQVLCDLGIKNGPIKFILWGDSHADKISYGLDEYARNNNIRGLKLSSPGCPPILDIDHVTNTEKWKCAENSRNALKYIINSNVKNIILVGRWDYFLPAEKDSIEAIRDNPGPRIKMMKDNQKLYDLDAFTVAFRETINDLRQLEAKIFIIKQVPAHKLYISSTLAKYMLLHRDKNILKRPLADVLIRRAPVDDVFNQNLGENIIYIDPINYFCRDGKSCQVEANGRSLYLDNTHLTVYGSLWLQGLWKDILN